jgi:small subunit ribosomal protein S2
MAIKISLKELIESGAHFGHQSKRWNPKMKVHLHGIKEGIHIFDLTKTKKALEEALKILKQASKDGEKILFLGTKKQAKEKTRQVAIATGSFFVDERWLGGTLTNFDQMKKSTSKLTEMKKKLAKGEYKNHTKKERLLIEREIARLERFFGGIVDMQKLPDLLIVVDTKKEIGAVREAKMKGVKTIAVVDSNSDPTLVDYAIPMNDDATRAIDYVLGLMQQAIEEGKKTSRKSRKVSKSGKS